LTSNTDATAIADVRQQLKRIEQALGQIVRLHEGMQVAVQDEDWPTFLELTGARQQLLADALSIQQGIDGDQVASETRISAQLRERLAVVQAQLKKVAKVDGEIFDSITIKREEMRQGMSNANNGLVFLKRYGNQLNQERVISKVY
jgi:hypothetical protein